MEDIQKIYYTIYQSDQLLQNAANYFQNNIKGSPGFFQLSIKLLFSNTQNKKFEKFLYFAIKHLIKNYWNSIYITDQEKNQILKIFMIQIQANLLKKESLKEIANLIGDILLDDQYENWIPLFNQLEQLIQNYNPCTNNLLSLILILMEKGKEKTIQWVRIFCEIGPKLFANNSTTQLEREKIIKIYYLCIKNLNWCESTNQQYIIQQLKSSLVNWNSLFLMILSAKGEEYLTIQYYVLKCLTILFRDLKELAVQISEQILPQFLKFFFYITQIYLNEEIWNKQFSDNEDQLEDTFNIEKILEGVCITMVDFLSCLCFFNSIKDQIFNSLFVLIWNLTHLALITSEDILNWESDTEQYISDPEEEINNYTVRNSVLDTLNNFIEKYDQQVSCILLEIIFYFINNTDIKDKWAKNKFVQTKKNFKLYGIDIKRLSIQPGKYIPNMEQIWRRKETGFFLLGNFIKDFIGTEINQNVFEESNVVQILIDKIGSTNNFILKGRLIWTLCCMRNLFKINNNLFLQVYSIVSQHLNSQFPLCIRLCASKAITILSYKIAINKLQKMIKNELGLNLNLIIEKIIELLYQSSYKVQNLLLDNLISLYDIDPIMIEKFTSQKLMIFLLNIFKVRNQNILFLELLQDIFKRILSNKQKGSQFYQLLLQYIKEFFQVYIDDAVNNDQLSHILDLLIFAIKQDLQNSMQIQLYQQLITLSKNVQDPRIVVKLTILFKNIIWSDQYQSQQNDLNPLIQQLILQLISIKENESKCVYVGNLVMIFCERNQTNRNPEILMALIRKLQKSSLPSTNQGIIIYFSFLILKNKQELMNFLKTIQIDTKYGLKILFDHWLLHQPKFIGNKTKSITISALMEILLLKDIQLENLYVIGINPSHKKKSFEVKLPIKILSLLLEILQFEQKQLKIQQNTLLNTEERTQQYINDQIYNERLDTSYQDDNSQNSLDVELNMNFIEEDDENDSFNDNGKNNGFGGVETGSQSYMSGLLGFDDVDNHEYDETTEDDLGKLGVQQIDLIYKLKEFLIHIKSDQYFARFLKDLPQKIKIILEKVK